MSVATGMLAELYSSLYLGIAVAMAAMMTMLGSVIAPVVESYIVEMGGWRWAGWSMLIICKAVSAETLLILRETSTRVLRRCQDRGADTQRIATLARKYFAQPVLMFVCKLILIIITTYLTLTYSTLGSRTVLGLDSLVKLNIVLVLS